MRVQVSEITQRLLDSNEWDIRERGTIRLKGKKPMKTFFISRLTGNISERRFKTSKLGFNTSYHPHTSSPGSKKVCPIDDETIEPSDVSSRSGFSGNINHQNDNDPVHDSNYSLFSRNRFKPSCFIIWQRKLSFANQFTIHSRVVRRLSPARWTLLKLRLEQQWSLTTGQ